MLGTAWWGEVTSVPCGISWGNLGLEEPLSKCFMYKAGKVVLAICRELAGSCWQNTYMYPLQGAAWASSQYGGWDPSMHPKKTTEAMSPFMPCL